MSVNNAFASNPKIDTKPNTSGGHRISGSQQSSPIRWNLAESMFANAPKQNVHIESFRNTLAREYINGFQEPSGS